jgi:hypothetical protein
VTPAEHARVRASLAGRLRREFRAAWGRVDRRDIRGSWGSQIPRLLVLLTSGQLIAAGSADEYVASSLEDESPWEVEPRAFAGIASDGRELETLLWRPAVSALSSLQEGKSLQYAMAGGRISAELIGHTQVADAGRVADLTAGAAHPETRSYVRMAVGPTCSRCLLLTGKRYSWKADFKRHPRCDCIVIPSAEAISTDPAVNVQAAFKQMPRAEQDRVFTKAGAEAIRAGADIGQVVNARRGMQTASAYGQTVRATTEGTTRRRRFGTRLDRRRPRLMPEEILRQSGGDRTEVIRLLSLHGYIRAKG